jgi:hypothetical protein
MPVTVLSSPDNVTSISPFGSRTHPAPQTPCFRSVATGRSDIPPPPPPVAVAASAHRRKFLDDHRFVDHGDTTRYVVAMVPGGPKRAAGTKIQRVVCAPRVTIGHSGS